MDFQVCPICEKSITDRGALCAHCRDARQSHLDGMITAISYENPVTKKLIHHYKYRFVRDISLPLSKLISRVLVRNDFPLPDFLVPVPLHPRRLRWRGFNQSLLLANHISEELAPILGIEVVDAVNRVKYNRPQMQLNNYRERILNVQNIFELNPLANPAILKNKKILLIDDIATTGATLQECSNILKMAGAKRVFAAVVARQSVKK